MKPIPRNRSNNNVMKHILAHVNTHFQAIAITSCLALSLASCGKGKNQTDEKAQTKTDAKPQLDTEAYNYAIHALKARIVPCQHNGGQYFVWRKLSYINSTYTLPGPNIQVSKTATTIDLEQPAQFLTWKQQPLSEADKLNNIDYPVTMITFTFPLSAHKGLFDNNNEWTSKTDMEMSFEITRKSGKWEDSTMNLLPFMATLPLEEDGQIADASEAAEWCRII